MKRIFALFALSIMFTCALPLSGCWDMVEINERIYVMGVGIDSISGSDVYTFQLAIPIGLESAADENSVEYRSLSFSGDNMASAVRELEKNSLNKVSFEHLACVLLGSNAAEAPIASQLEFLLNDAEVRRQSVVAVSEGYARDMLNNDSYQGSIAIDIAELLEKFDRARSQSAVMSLYRLDVLNTDGCGMCVMRVGLEENSPAVRGMNVYTDRLTGTLDRDSAELILLFSGSQSEGMLSVLSKDGRTIVYRISSSTCTTACDIIDGHPAFDISVSAVCSLVDSDGGAVISDSELSDALYGMLRPIIEDCLGRLGGAPVGLYTAVRRQQPEWYRRNRDNLGELLMDSTVSLSVTCRTLDGGRRG